MSVYELNIKHPLVKISLIVTTGLLITSGILFKQVVFSDSVADAVTPLSKVVVALSPQDKLRGIPARIMVPTLGINVGIENGIYSAANHSWNLSNYNAHYAEKSAPANVRGGNTFIYGHNSRNIFGLLPSINIGDQAIVVTAENLKFYYQLEEISEVQPDDVAVLNYSGEPILTVQTCSGNWNEKRQMFRFKLMRVEVPASADI